MHCHGTGGFGISSRNSVLHLLSRASPLLVVDICRPVKKRPDSPARRISVYVLGFATGPIVWAPFSEVKGRRPPMLLDMMGFALFEFGVAVARDIQTIIICRYFGVFGSSSITLVAAVLPDFYTGRARGLRLIIYVITVFSGTFLGPYVGGLTVMNSSLGWRWTQHICGILGGALTLSLVLLLDESYGPDVQANKAVALRRRTGNWALHSRHEELQVNLSEIVQTYLARPLKMLVLDPIVLFLGIFLAFVYGLLYLFLTAYPIVFQQICGFNPGVGGLPYLSVMVGQFLDAFAMILYQPWFHRKVKVNNGKATPEWHLAVSIPGAVAFSVGLFWFGWSGYRADISWIAPTMSGMVFGFGMSAVLLPPLIYLAKVYGK
ncbi:hypothetical protein VTN00DRAFT_4004 [Thermoascus crustaceus]|uniref:uncharacterized protein n=1 Tax=Thermoascus crustaceus TaxID=5088 RepID=UPI003741F9D7